MKNIVKLIGTAIILVVITLIFITCDVISITAGGGTKPGGGDTGTPGGGGNQTPITGDFNISGLSHIYDGRPKTVNIIPKSGKSKGAITVKYDGGSAPSVKGIYTVTFDVAAATGWEAARDLYAGKMEISEQVMIAQTPTAADFSISDLSHIYDGSLKPVNITPKAGKSQGAITVKYSGETAAPSDAGFFTVTFDIEEAVGWKAATGLSAGTLTISNATPVAADFEFGNMRQQAYGLVHVTITPKQGKSNGAITIYFAGTGNTTYTKTTVQPTVVGTYAVTFDVAGVTNWKAATGLKAGTFMFLLPDEMVWIPGGSFMKEYKSTVTMAGFYMGKYEVTQYQYIMVMGNKPSFFNGNPAPGERPENRPVERVSWYDAIVFCNKLSMAEGLTPAYRISGSTNPSDWGIVPTSDNAAWNAAAIVSGTSGYRLPTEDQWEYAGNGGNGSPDWGKTFVGSSNLGNSAWYRDNSNGMTHEVGKKDPNRLGLYDMSGNVWEWCFEHNGNSLDRAIRGGNWDSPDAMVFWPPFGGQQIVIAQLDPREQLYYSEAYHRSDKIGFRVVRP
jgi:formylglycine-generating enzyme required for sulfatase activity